MSVPRRLPVVGLALLVCLLVPVSGLESFASDVDGGKASGLQHRLEADRLPAPYQEIFGTQRPEQLGFARSTQRAALAAFQASLTRPEGSTASLQAAPAPLKGRGGTDWTKVYRKAAPAVMFLVGEQGFGTGFLIDDGWIVTNRHVAVGGELGGDRHWRLSAYVGELKDNGEMVARSDPLPVVVHEWDPRVDLALLRLEGDDEAWEDLKHLELDKPDKPASGQDVAAIGNADIGLLWAMKPGHIASIGSFARSRPFVLHSWNELLRRTRTAEASSDLRQQFRDHIDRTFQGWEEAHARIIQATAGVSPGDSGGPLLNGASKVVGVSQSVSSGSNTATSASYFVHVEELHKLLDRAPRSPRLELATSMWDTGAVAHSVGDATANGVVDQMVGLDHNDQRTLFAADLDEDSGLNRFLKTLPIRVPLVGVHAVDDRLVSVYGNGSVMVSSRSEPIWGRSTQGQPTCSDVADDGRLGAVGLVEGNVVLFSPSTGEGLQTEILDGSPVIAVAMDPVSATVWAGTAEGSLVEVDTSGKVVTRSSLPAPIMSLTVSLDGSLVVAALYGDATVAVDSGNGKMVWTQPDFPAYMVRQHPGGDLIAASPQSDDHGLTWLSLRTGEIAAHTPTGGSPFGFELSPDGSMVCVALMADMTYELLDVEAGTSIARWPALPDEEGLMMLTAMQASGNLSPIGRFAFRPRAITTGDPTGIHHAFSLADQEATTFTLASEELDVQEVVKEQAFDAEFAIVIDHVVQSSYALFDLDGDGMFDLVRVDDGLDGSLDSQYERAGDRFRALPAESGEPVFLPPVQAPSEWRQAYGALLMSGS